MTDIATNADSFLADAAEQLAAKGPSAEKLSSVAILEALTQLGGSRVQEDALEFTGTRFVLPANYQGRLPEAVRFLENYQDQQAAMTDMSRTFDYLPYDVAHAVQAAMRKVFGTTGTGVAIQTMFGSIPPEFITVDTGVNTTTQVPWERIQFDALSGTIDLTYARKHGSIVGRVIVNAPRKYRSAVEGFFKAVENELKTGSIYKGKALINGSWDGIQFLDTGKVRREDVVYGDEVMSHLEANLWVPIRHTEALRAAGQPVKRAVLLEGPYGTGKSLAGYLTAQEAERNGWTFIFCKPGSDLNQAMQTAKLYAPAVVFFEDIDVLQSNDPESVSRLLDSFDGISGKGQEVIAVLTTNNKEKIHKGMLRPGRLDALIHIAELDRGGVERLVKASVPNDLLVDVDYDTVFTAVQGYLPAFVREVASRAFRYAMAREGGVPTALFTEDFVAAANSLREQFDLMSGAAEVKDREGTDAALRHLVADVMESVTLLDRDGDRVSEDDAQFKPWHVKVNRNK